MTFKQVLRAVFVDSILIAEWSFVYGLLLGILSTSFFIVLAHKIILD